MKWSDEALKEMEGRLERRSIKGDIMTIKCRKCDSNAFIAAERGAHLKRVNRKGEAGIWECWPGCNSSGNKEDALIGAIKNAL